MYGASGQVTQDIRDSSATYVLNVNAAGRNAGASLNGTAVGAYLYNAFGQRVQKVAGADTIQFVYNSEGHLLLEANTAGVPLREYIWLDDTPVAMVDSTKATPAVYYIIPIS